MINWLLTFFFGDLYRKRIDELNRIEQALNDKIAKVNTTYTTVKSFRGMDKTYYSWLCVILERDEYRYMLFDIRENILREMAGRSDKDQVMRDLGRLDTIGIIDNYIKRYKAEFEEWCRKEESNA